MAYFIIFFIFSWWQSRDVLWTMFAIEPWTPRYTATRIFRACVCVFIFSLSQLFICNSQSGDCPQLGRVILQAD